MFRNKSPKKQTKGVEVRKEKSKEVVKPKVLKKEAEKTPHVKASQSPQKILQQELWSKAIRNVSNMSNLSNEESSIVKLLADYKTKSSIPQKSTKLKVCFCYYLFVKIIYYFSNYFLSVFIEFYYKRIF